MDSEIGETSCIENPPKKNKKSPGNTTESPTKKPSRKYTKEELTCKECGKEWPSRHKLKRHQLIHSNLRPFKCSQCPAKFKTEKCVRSHQDVHVGDIICEFCLATFATQGGLSHHKKHYH